MELMTNAEVREYLGISKQLLRYYVLKGYIRRVPNRRQYLYVKEDVEYLKPKYENNFN